MICGAPSVASNLPGVRQPVLMTGMGEIAPIGDPAGLAEAILRVLRDKVRYQRPPQVIAEPFAPAETARHYENLFSWLLTGKSLPDAGLRRGLDAYTRLRELTGRSPRNSQDKPK